MVEAAPQIGGAAVTREFVPGYKVSGVAHLLHGLHPTIARDLDLARHGLDLKAQRVETRSLLPGGRSFDLGSHRLDQLAADAEAYPTAMARLTRMADALAAYALHTPPQPDAMKMDWQAKLNLGKFAWSLRRLGKKDMLELTRILTMNVNDLANDYFESEAVKGLLCFEGVLGLCARPALAQHGVQPALSPVQPGRQRAGRFPAAQGRHGQRRRRRSAWRRRRPAS